MKSKRGPICMVVGFLLLLSAIGLMGYNKWQERQSEQVISEVMEEMEQVVVPVKRKEKELPKQLQSVTIDGYEYIGILSLPTVGKEFPILKSWSDDLLKISPCRYKGSYLKDNMIIAGHNYSTGFGLLKSLEIGEPVEFTDTIGNTQEYEVLNIEIIEGTDIQGMEDKVGDGWDLTLFSCTYGGQSRYAVRCAKVEE